MACVSRQAPAAQSWVSKGCREGDQRRHAARALFASLPAWHYRLGWAQQFRVRQGACLADGGHLHRNVHHMQRGLLHHCTGSRGTKHRMPGQPLQLCSGCARCARAGSPCAPWAGLSTQHRRQHSRQLACRRPPRAPTPRPLTRALDGHVVVQPSVVVKLAILGGIPAQVGARGKPPGTPWCENLGPQGAGAH